MRNIVYQIVDTLSIRQPPLRSPRTGTSLTRRSACTAVARIVLSVACTGTSLACGGDSAGGIGEPVQPTPIVTTGTAVPELASFDRVLTTLMGKWGIPGGAIADVKDGRLVLAHGYGYADAEAKAPVARALRSL